ncbi:hypothetical protein Pcinc_014483 [Petrolisthes cinctipes]|uniref:Uncharacterized protein n=1 Tax=Petrolisthes cinctipes TaxID=88211 RepID=A0AAE1FWU5_PETCI|nr:hypothetical protein Pcinc_014483 [Petrolisthes cinctipes]
MNILPQTSHCTKASTDCARDVDMVGSCVVAGVRVTLRGRHKPMLKGSISKTFPVSKLEEGLVTVGMLECAVEVDWSGIENSGKQLALPSWPDVPPSNGGRTESPLTLPCNNTLHQFHTRQTEPPTKLYNIFST